MGGFLHQLVIARDNGSLVSVPSRGMGGFLQLSYSLTLQGVRVSVPSRGMGGFLPHILYPKRETIHKIVPTWKLT